jgi:DNA-binding transcriptional MerR regulator
VERLISIGQFAQLSGLSPKAIRLYGDLGILQPSSVDDWTGYRRYHPDQLARARMIAILRRSGIAFGEIRSFLAAPNVERVEQWERELDVEIQSRKTHLAAVKTLIERIEGTKEPAMTSDQLTQVKAVRLSRAVPILASTNLDETVQFYQERLAFKALFQSEDYAIMGRDDVTINFWLCDNDEIPKVTACRVQVQGVAELYRECVAAGVVHPNGPLENKPWGTQEFAALDVHGNLITFFESRGH